MYKQTATLMSDEADDLEAIPTYDPLSSFNYAVYLPYCHKWPLLMNK